jgi:HK97 family phage prohead protease
MDERFEAAAAARREGVRSAGDRPSQRHSPLLDAYSDRGLRRSDDPTMSDRAGVPTPGGSFTVRAASEEDDAPLVFDGYASVTGLDRGYEMWDWAGPYTEYVHVGAFAETLASTPDVPLVLDHRSMWRLARTGNTVSPLILSEVTDGDTTGLHVLAPSLQRDNPYVREIEPLLRSGLIDEMSFRFTITAGRWSEDWMEYHIHSVDIHRGDVAIVGYGANPHTTGSGLRSEPEVPAQAGPSSAARALLALSRADDDKYRHLTTR